MSSWCAAELGAFWGAGKDVIIYLADSSLQEDQLPRQFRGHLLERNMFRVAAAVEARMAPEDQESGARPFETVAALSLTQFRSLLLESIAALIDRSQTTDLLFEVAGTFDHDSDTERQKRMASRSLNTILGQVLPKPLEIRVRGWRYTFEAKTTTGNWLGYALTSESHADGMLDL